MREMRNGLPAEYRLSQPLSTQVIAACGKIRTRPIVFPHDNSAAPSRTFAEQLSSGLLSLLLSFQIKESRYRLRQLILDLIQQGKQVVKHDECLWMYGCGRFVGGVVMSEVLEDGLAQVAAYGSGGICLEEGQQVQFGTFGYGSMIGSGHSGEVFLKIINAAFKAK